MSLATLPKTYRTLARVRVIMQVLSKHGFGWVVDRYQLGRAPTAWLKRKKPVEEPETDPMKSIGVRLVRVCEELGPTFIKLGQMASTRPDIVPPQILNELARLQDDVRPFPTEQARHIFLTDIGTTVEKSFLHFPDEPFASGSIAQVYRATTRDGQDVVVKVKRPAIDHTIQMDIYVLKWMADRAEALFPELKPYRPKMLVEEFEQRAHRELDFVNEASATERFHNAFKGDPNVRTPRVRWDLTGPGVLTLEFMDGVHLRDVVGGKETNGRTPAPDGQKPAADVSSFFDKKALAHNLAESFLKQYFELGIFHGDPHPGNLLFRSPDGVILYDFGLVAHMDDELIGRLVLGIVAAVRLEVDVVIDVLADLGAVSRETDRDSLKRDLRELLEKYYGLPLYRFDVAVIFRELLETVRRNHVTLPRDFVMMFKSLGTISGVVLQLDPKLNLLELIQPKLTKLLKERFAPRRLMRMGGLTGLHVLTIIRDAPRLLRDLMRGLGRGQFQVNIKHENIDYLASELDRSSNRVAIAISMAATIMGSSMMLSMQSSVRLFDLFEIRYLGLVGFGLAFIMGIGLIIAIIRSGRMS